MVRQVSQCHIDEVDTAIRQFGKLVKVVPAIDNACIDQGGGAFAHAIQYTPTSGGIQGQLRILAASHNHPQYNVVGKIIIAKLSANVVTKSCGLPRV